MLLAKWRVLLGTHRHVRGQASGVSFLLRDACECFWSSMRRILSWDA